jgi:hypothetical protein
MSSQDNYRALFDDNLETGVEKLFLIVLVAKMK